MRWKNLTLLILILIILSLITFGDDEFENGPPTSAPEQSPFDKAFESGDFTTLKASDWAGLSATQLATIQGNSNALSEFKGKNPTAFQDAFKTGKLQASSLKIDDQKKYISDIAKAGKLSDASRTDLSLREAIKNEFLSPEIVKKNRDTFNAIIKEDNGVDINGYEGDIYLLYNNQIGKYIMQISTNTKINPADFPDATISDETTEDYPNSYRIILPDSSQVQANSGNHISINEEGDIQVDSAQDFFNYNTGNNWIFTTGITGSAFSSNGNYIITTSFANLKLTPLEGNF